MSIIGVMSMGILSASLRFGSCDIVDSFGTGKKFPAVQTDSLKPSVLIPNYNQKEEIADSLPLFERL